MTESCENDKVTCFLLVLNRSSQLLTASGNLFMNRECSGKIYGKEKNMALFTHCEALFVNLRDFSQNALVDLLV